MNRCLRYLCVGIFFIMMLFLQNGSVMAGTIYESPYVSFSPDGRAWTTNRGVTDYSWYPVGTTVFTNRSSSLRKLNVGEHYYHVPRYGEVPIGRWEVTYRTGTCIHNAYPPANNSWHDVEFNRNPCERYYFSGWNSYCADCGERISVMLMYMSREAAGSIDSMDCGSGVAYYYLCPWCDNLEQGSDVGPHSCKAISPNQYRVHYDANTYGIYGGYMADSIHMYGNADVYEGEKLVPVTRLSKNNYTRIGYVFAGWNTKSDGSGTFYEDEEEILNLTDADYREDKQAGMVTLYACWKKVSSTLIINAEGGSYKGKSQTTSVTGSYKDVYEIDLSDIVPPKGCTVKFDTCGGADIPDAVGTKHFKGFTMSRPFLGGYIDNIYTFGASDGSEDILTADYVNDPIVLPEPKKQGFSFGGWYYDSEYKNMAGGAGDRIVTDKDIVLYAKWVDLKLVSKINWQVNDGKGAVDLSWKQNDNLGKVYKIYQSKADKMHWLQVNCANDFGERTSINKFAAYSGYVEGYVVPSTGLYDIIACGARGGNYGGYYGGSGGRVSARVWLYSGENLYYNLGGTNGYNGGGTGSLFSNGGGCSVVSTDKKGIILVAGGGGSASIVGNGGAGGADTSLIDTGMNGENGAAGGGGGMLGGSAGELIVHHHTSECYIDLSTDILSEYSDKKGEWTYTYDDDYDSKPVRVLSYGAGIDSPAQNEFSAMGDDGFPEKITPKDQIPTNGATKLSVELLHICTVGVGFDKNFINAGGFAVYDQNGNRIYFGNNDKLKKYCISVLQRYDSDGNEEDWDVVWGPVSNPRMWYQTYSNSDRLLETNSDLAYNPGTDSTIARAARDFGGTTYGNFNPDYYGSQAIFFIEEIALPEGTTSISIVSEMQAADVRAHDFYTLKLSGERRCICGYEEGQVISSKPAYGGSNYINTDFSVFYTDEAGICMGEGCMSIASDKIGFLDSMSMSGVWAPDEGRPDMIDEQTISKKLLNDRTACVSWEEPEDTGTEYYHCVKSYRAGSGAYLCDSNITHDNVVSGIEGYYIILDENPLTVADERTAFFSTDKSKNVELDGRIKYLHVAAVDRAGNVGGTLHICINPFTDFAWEPYTDKLSIKGGDNVYYNAYGDIYYVRDDGFTPFELVHNGGVNGMVSYMYEPNHAVFETECGDIKGAYTVSCKNAVVRENVGVQNSDIETSQNGELCFYAYPYTTVKRYDFCKKMSTSQKFLFAEGMSSKKIVVTPRMGADFNEKVVYSDLTRDYKNGITIIGDGDAPDITGMEVFDNLKLIDRDNVGDLTVSISAYDELSGLKEFKIVVNNIDNAVEMTYTADKNGKVEIELTKDIPLFSGDFAVSAYAIDNVGNESRIDSMATEFALQTKIERILSPHEPIFKCGESGILTISTWGYADYVEVEFPKCLTELNPGLDRKIVYTDIPKYRQDECIQFMIPLYAPQGSDYEVTVRAYKGGRKLEEHPRISIVKIQGTILDDFRTRLR